MKSNELYEAIKNLPPEHAQAFTAIIDIKVSEDVQAIFSKIESKMEMLFEKTNSRIDKLETSTNSRIDHLEREMLTLHQSTNQRINYLLAAIGIVGTLVMSVITPLVLHFLNR
jgi:hypothetical protein